MMERGHEITVITSEDARFRNYDSIFFPRASITRAPCVGQLRGAKLYFHPLMLDDLFKRFDVVHAFTFFTTSSLLGALANVGIRVLRSEIGPSNGRTFAKSKYRFSLYPFLIRIYKDLYNYITAYNYIEVKSLLTLGFDKRKIIIISPMIDYDKFSKLAGKGVQDGDHIVLGVIARISQEKGIHRLVPLIKCLLKELGDDAKKFHVSLAGRIDDPSYGYRVLSELRESLGERFTYLGEVAPPHKFYRMVNAVIVPSIIETGAINVLEAMAAGKIVIAGNIYPINLYIRHGIDGFLFTRIFEAVKILKSVMDGSENIERIRRNAQSRVKCYDYRLHCSKLERVYKLGNI